MTIYVYDGVTKKHPAGFLGVRVVTTIGDEEKKSQKYFSFRTEPRSSKLVSAEEQESIIREAIKLHDKWRAQAKAVVRAKKWNQPHGKTNKARSAGFGGIMLDFVVHRREKPRINRGMVMYEYWRAVFRVSDKPVDHIFYINDDVLNYSDAWKDAVHKWAEIHSVPEHIVAEKLKAKPLPSQFKMLRRALNSEKGMDIPVEALHHVFADQRREIKNKPKPNKPNLTVVSESDIADNLKREIEAFMNNKSIRN